MKKFFALLLAAVLTMTIFIGCNKTDEEKDTPATTEATESTTEGGDVDAVTTASIVDNAEGVVNALSADGTWIVATLNDVVVEQEIKVEGQFHDKDDPAKDIYRKLALYTQDEEHNIIDQFSLTAPKMVVGSENFKIQGVTFIGDVYVEAN